MWWCRTKGGEERCAELQSWSVWAETQTQRQTQPTINSIVAQMDWLAILQDGRLSAVTFPLLSALRGLLAIEGFVLLSSAVGNVQFNMNNNHRSSNGFSLMPRVSETRCVGGGGHGSSVYNSSCWRCPFGPITLILHEYNCQHELKMSDGKVCLRRPRRCDAVPSSSCWQ